jgi:hypothetical protein
VIKPRTAPVEEHNSYSQTPSRQLAAELVDLTAIRSSISMLPAAASLERNWWLTPEQLHTNPLSCMEFEVENETVLQDLSEHMARLMPAEPEQHIQEWLDEKLAVSCCNVSLYFHWVPLYIAMYIGNKQDPASVDVL